MRNKLRLPLRSMTVLCLMLGYGANAHAASVSYYLNQSNVDSAPLVDGINYAKVTIDNNTANKLTFNVTLLSPLTSIAGTNFGIQDFSFNVVGSSLPSDSGTVAGQWTLASGWSVNVAPPPNQADGFGRFDAQVSTTGSNRANPTLTFSLNNTALNLSSFAEASTNGNGQGNVYFAAHVTGFNGPNAVTGGYFGGSAPVVPVPAAAWLFGSGLIGLTGLARTRKAA